MDVTPSNTADLVNYDERKTLEPKPLDSRLEKQNDHSLRVPLIYKSHDCLMRVFIKIGEKVLPNGKKEDEKITLCLCPYSWGSENTKVTCS